MTRGELHRLMHKVDREKARHHAALVRRMETHLGALLNGAPPYAPKHTGPVKVVSMNREGDAYVALLECPIDSIDFHLKVSDGKPFEDPTDTKPCPICDFVLDPNGECVNHKCPNWIKE